MTAALNVSDHTSAHPQGGADPSAELGAVAALAPQLGAAQLHDGAPVIPTAALQLQRRTFSKGEYLYDVGHEAHSAYIVEAGLVALTLGAVADRQRVVALAGPGDVIGALTPNLAEHQSGAVALSGEVAARVLPTGGAANPAIGGAINHATATTAATTSTTSTTSTTTTTDTLNHDFSGLLANAAGDQIQRLTWALEDSAHPVPARVARTLLRLGERFGHHTDDGTVRLTLPVTHDTLASLVGAARETTTYTIQQLRKKGLLAGTRGSYRFEPRALARFADDAALAGR